MLLHGHKTSTKTPNLRAQGLARAGPDASADLASLLYAAASQHTAAAAREATAAGAARPAEARACSQPAPRSPEFTASGIAAARLGSARLAHSPRRRRRGSGQAGRAPRGGKALLRGLLSAGRRRGAGPAGRAHGAERAVPPPLAAGPGRGRAALRARRPAAPLLSLSPPAAPARARRRSSASGRGEHQLPSRPRVAGAFPAGRAAPVPAAAAARGRAGAPWRGAKRCVPSAPFSAGA